MHIQWFGDLGLQVQRTNALNWKSEGLMILKLEPHQITVLC